MNAGAAANNPYKQNLTILKQLWTSKASEHVIKQTIWSFKQKLPVEYEQSIIYFCSSQHQKQFQSQKSNMQSNTILIIPNSNAFLSACRIFKELDCFNYVYRKIQDFEYFLQTQIQLMDHQVHVCLFNLACLYESLNLDTKAERIIDIIKSNSNICSTLQARIHLKHNRTSTNKSSNPQSSTFSQIIKRYTRLTKAEQNIKYINNLKNCKLYEIFNIALCFKKNKNHQIALNLFQFITNQAQQEQKISVFSKLNIAECYFEAGVTAKAVKMLTAVVESEFFVIQHYKREIWNKIHVWSKSQQILGLAANFGVDLLRDAKNFIYHTKIDSQSKSLFKNKKCMILKQKHQELQNLLNPPQSGEIQPRKLQHSHKLSQPYRLFKPSNTKSSLRSLISTKKSDLSKITKDERSIISLKNNKLTKMSSINQYLQQGPNKLSEIESRKSQTSRKATQNSGSVDNNLIEHYWTVIKNSQDQVQIAEKYLNLGDAYFKDGDYENSEMVYKRALEKGRYEAYGRIGNLYYRTHRLNQALQYYQKYLKYVDGSDHQIKMKLLHCYTKIPEYYKKANQKLKQILSINPHDTEAHILHATVLMKQNHISKAIQLCQEFIKLKYTCYQNHHLLGLLYKHVGKVREAYDCFVNALRVNSCDVSSLLELVELADIQNFLPEIISIYKKALKINKENHQIIQILQHLIAREKISFTNMKQRLNFAELIGIGDFFLQKQMIEQAEYAYKQAGEYTSNTLLKQKLGDLEYAKNNFAQAQKYYRESQLRKPLLKIQIKLADTLLKQNKWEEGKEILNECLIKGIESKSVCLNLLGQCQYGLGNYQLALEKFKLSMSLGYNRKINQVWERTCHRKIIDGMKYGNSGL